MTVIRIQAYFARSTIMMIKIITNKHPINISFFVVNKTKSFDPFDNTNDFISEKVFSNTPECREFVTEASSI